MSDYVLPSLVGLGWDIKRRSVFNTNIFRANSGREVRTTMQAYPLTEFTLKYDVLRDTASYVEAQTLLGFYLSRQGSLDSFRYMDPLDYVANDCQFGVGTGSQTQFQLTRPLGAGGFTFSEPVQNAATLTALSDNGVGRSTPSEFDVSSTGMVTFVTAPASGHILRWTGTFYYRVRFLDDGLDLTNFASAFWKNEGLRFVGATGNRV